MYRRREDGRLIVSATDLVGFLACGHLTQLERAVAAGLLDRPVRDDPEIELLRKRGYAHEERYIAQLEADGRRVTALPEKGVDGERLALEVRAEQTSQAMLRGDDVIFQATFFDGRWVGHPDFLLRVNLPADRQSKLGGYHYEVADTKLAHTARASALIQICSYVEQLMRFQGTQPEHVHVVLGGPAIRTESFRTAELMAYYRNARARFERTVDDSISGPPVHPVTATYPDPVEHCAVCRWSYVVCRPLWRADDALPLVAGISRAQREVLRQHDVPTRRALASLTQPFDLGLKPSAQQSMWRMREQARLQVASDDAGRLLYELLPPEQATDSSLVPDRGLSALPEPSAGDLFFDIEGDPFAYNIGLDYLFGVHEPGGGLGLSPAWHAIWAKSQAEEKQAFEKVMDLFIERLERDPSMHIYHYAPYEPTALKRLAGRHATREEELDRLLRGRVFVDLYRVVRQGVRVGAESYSIKRLEPLYGFTRDVELRDANASIVEFEAYLEGGSVDQSVLDRIELYNRDDCVSAQRLRDWLEARRPEAEAQFGIASLPRPLPGEELVNEELGARQQLVRDLERRLADGISADAALRTPEQNARWLLAQLMDWHRREEKSTWWRFYDLLTRSDEELFEEKEPIGWLSYVDVVGETKKSLIHRYRFPTQEHSIDAGNEVHDPRASGRETKTGTVHAIDDAAGTVDIKRPKAWAGAHPTSIVPLDVYRTDVQKAALIRIGEWVATRGVEAADAGPGSYRAARDLLMAGAPRAGQALDEELVREGETGTQAGRRLALLLDATTLPIQGPPGSGKTYSGARMILDLVRDGRRVGITATSHKVISNLLRAVCEAAASPEERGVVLRAIQKVDGPDGTDDSCVRLVKDNDQVTQALAEGEVDVVAGTTWLWAREDMADSVDTLFVDEAGQMSLANVVAISGAARNIVLLGDPQQLDQPLQGVHPPGADRSALAHFLGDSETVPLSRGLFLERTWRLHPQISDFTSELFYENRLKPVEGLEAQRIVGADQLSGSGLRWLAVDHEGRTNESIEEAVLVADIVRSLLGRSYVGPDGSTRPIGWDDILIVSPFNAHRLLIQKELGERARVGTVDKFQGQEAPVSIYTMATSRPEDAPRGLGFLYSLNRLNVATSRARALAIVVGSRALLTAVARTPAQMRMVNGLCAFVEAAEPIISAPEPVAPVPA